MLCGELNVLLELVFFWCLDGRFNSPQSCHMGSLIDFLSLQPFICLDKRLDNLHCCYFSILFSCKIWDIIKIIKENTFTIWLKMSFKMGFSDIGPKHYKLPFTINSSFAPPWHMWSRSSFWESLLTCHSFTSSKGGN